MSQQLRINFVAKDQLLIEKIRYYFRHTSEVLIVYSDSPLNEEDADIYIAPVQDEELVTLNTRRRREPLPIIYYGDASSVRKAFLAGCSDYLKDPWSLEELELRLFKIIRGIKKTYTFPWGSITFSDTDVVTEKGKCPLTYQEFRIFNLLLKQRGSVVSREVLYYVLWNNPGTEESRVVDMHISSIRKKLKKLIPVPDNKEVITSVRGIGYMIK
jgi:DNA-binding response OmpR family regulator